MALRLTRDDLTHVASRPKAVAGGKTWDAYVDALTSKAASDLFDQYDLTTPLRVQHFLATVSAETNLSVLWESGAYSAAGILRVFGAGHHSSAVTQAEASWIASLPINSDGTGKRADALFERVYGYKTKIGKQLGNTVVGDGAKYRGLGPLQITGKWAHTKYAGQVGCSVEELSKPINCLHAALCEWDAKNCNKYADSDDPVSIRKLINGGSLNVSVSRINGLPEAQAALRRAKAVITVADFQDESSTQVAESDVPDRSGGAVAANEDKPMSIWSSSEMQAGAGGSATTGVTAGNSWADCLPRAFERATATGRFSLTMFLFALLSDPIAWAAIGATVATGGIIYLMFMRYKRFFHFGV